MTIDKVLKMFKRKELVIAIEDNEEFYKLMDILDDNGYYGYKFWNEKKLSPKEYVKEDDYGKWDYLFCTNDKEYRLDKCREAYLKTGYLFAKTIHASDIEDLSSNTQDIELDMDIYI